MEEQELDAFLVTGPENIFYLSAFTGGSDARLLISSDRQYIITDGRYVEQVGQQCPRWELVQEDSPDLRALTRIAGNYRRLAVESQHLTLESFRFLQQRLERELVPLANVIEAHRAVKDEKEIELLKDSARISDAVFSAVIREIREGQCEREIANRLTFLLKEKGCSREAFNTITIAGENAALPHGEPGHRPLAYGDMLLLDFGGFYRGYAGDMTRTLVIGEASRDFRERYQALRETQELGISLVKAGASGSYIHGQVKACLHKYGLDAYFNHGTGHGVGLEVHEQPRLSASSHSILEEKMVVTVEPGIYIPGWGGIRIEDTVIVQKGGCEVITHSSKELIIL